MIKIVLVSFLFFSCAKSSDSAPASGVSGIDFSGTWNLTGVHCFNTALSGTTTTATITNGFTESMVVTGNSFVTTSTISGCTVQVTGNIVGGETGMNFDSRKVLIASGGTCGLNMALSGGITPSNTLVMYTTNQVLTNYTNAKYYYNTISKSLGVPTNHTNGSGSDTCLLMYSKQ